MEGVPRTELWAVGYWAAKCRKKLVGSIFFMQDEHVQLCIQHCCRWARGLDWYIGKKKHISIVMCVFFISLKKHLGQTLPVPLLFES